MINVLFVCLGNICRSPMAEAVFQHLVEQEELADKIAVDSVGTGDWHVGEAAHHGTQAILRQRGIRYNGRARQIIEEDLRKADYVIAMDGGNYSDIQAFDRDKVTHDKLYLLLDFAPNREVRHVPDPYYANNFDEVYRLVEQGTRGLLQHIREEHRL